MSQRVDDVLVSIVLPFHFGSLGVEQVGRLRHALDVIQDLRSSETYEVILVDDGSLVPVQSLEPLLGAARLRFTRIVRHGRHLGLSQAFNTGLAQARYPWIAPFDLDEPWGRDALKTQLSRVRTDPNLSFCARAGRRPERVRAVAEKRVGWDEWSRDLHSFANAARPFFLGSILARADVFRLLGGYSHDPRSSHCDDYSFWSTWFRFFKPTLFDGDVNDSNTLEHDGVRKPVPTVPAPSSEGRSVIVRRRFSDLGVEDHIPWALDALARSLGCTVPQAGTLAYLMWRFGPAVRLPNAALAPLQALLPDRHVLMTNKADVEPEVIVPGLSLSFASEATSSIQAVL